MLIGLGILLVVGWILLKVFAGVVSFAVHALLVAAVAAVVVHFVRGRTGRRDATVG